MDKHHILQIDSPSVVVRESVTKSAYNNPPPAIHPVVHDD